MNYEGKNPVLGGVEVVWYSARVQGAGTEHGWNARFCCRSDGCRQPQDMVL